jgi:glycerate kinase
MYLQEEAVEGTGVSLSPEEAARESMGAAVAAVAMEEAVEEAAEEVVVVEVDTTEGMEGTVEAAEDSVATGIEMEAVDMVSLAHQN